ncbi:MAG TPA: heavy metal translocating P-type ATPase [Parvularcula sp.]|nr:heavy metal translocating P-type ATPase [Parvularcula sp.]
MNRNTAPVEANGDLYAEQAPAPPRPDDHAAALSSPHRRGGGDSKLDLHEHAGILGRHGELIFAFLSGAALAVGWLIERGGGAALPFYAAAYFFGGYFTLREAIGNIAAKRFRIDTLMLVAAAGAAALGSWAEGSLLLFLFSLGHALEEFAMGRARREIEALAKLAPDRANMRSGGAIKHVPVEDLRVGDVVVVRPNERLPADGVVVVGETSVNQAPVTGESAPVDKRPIAGRPDAAEFAKISAEHRVFAGTINGAGAIDVYVARPAAESTLARVARMVAEAQLQRSPTENFTDRFERLFVPCALALVSLLLCAWVVIDEPFSKSFYRAMAVLVAASPCALAISVPSAVLSGIARAGRGGVLIKGGAALENLGALSVVAFDKTGTLTEGKPKLVDIAPALGVAEADLLAVTVAIEEQSDHPLAAAVVRDAAPKLAEASRLRASAVESITGKGVKGVVAGDLVHVGKPAMFDGEDEAPMPNDVRDAARRLEQTGRTVIIVRRGARYLGALGLLDVEREFAGAVITELRQLGVWRMIMLTGDNQKVADAIAMKVGLSEARGALMPEDKAAFIRKLRSEEGAIAMIGDGVNDAPALAEATVGVAMGAAGSDVALETADVALMADDLRRLPFALGLSRQTSAIIKQNLWASLGVVALLIPATIFGLNIGAAVVVHEGSTLLVVANALRLLGYRQPMRAGAHPL